MPLVGAVSIRETTGDEYARASTARPQAYATGDRVRVTNTGEVGTVQFMELSSNGRFVRVRLDGNDQRNHRYRASGLERVEGLF